MGENSERNPSGSTAKATTTTYQGDHAHELFKELQLDCAGEHISADFQEAAIKNGIIIMYGSDRKENMGLAEVTMQHTELGMKSIMLESCMDTGDWPSAFRARIFLVNRYPKIKDVKSRDGDAPVAIEMMSNGRISRNTVHTELKHFCPRGRLAWVKNRKDIKGSSLSRRREMERRQGSNFSAQLQTGALTRGVNTAL